MIDHKQLFGLAAILFSLGFLLRSFLPAHAFNGPNISLESNPYFNVVDNGWNRTLYSYTIPLSIPTDQVAIIEKIVIKGNSAYCSLSFNGNEIDYSQITRLKVQATDTLQIMKKSGTGGSYCGSSNTSDNRIYIEGYYSHN